MFGLFKRRKDAKSQPQMLDLDDNPLAAGDEVMSLRYDLGKCTLVETEQGLEYESLETGERVSWVRMIDAATERQKVRKVLDSE